PDRPSAAAGSFPAAALFVRPSVTGRSAARKTPGAGFAACTVATSTGRCEDEAGAGRLTRVPSADFLKSIETRPAGRDR
ncbi:hypothetical protein, partial [Serratia marcescens]|uniref:hypothetical protein n=1 Tax=Serratia marcescens TaxID=615 RepID=UPI0019541DC0